MGHVGRYEVCFSPVVNFRCGCQMVDDGMNDEGSDRVPSESESMMMMGSTDPSEDWDRLGCPSTWSTSGLENDTFLAILLLEFDFEGLLRIAERGLLLW